MKDKIQIGQRRAVEQVETSWEGLDQEGFFVIDLNNWLADTRVGNVYFKKDCASNILDWVNESIKPAYTPEVGGLLIGSKRINPEREEQYELKLESFIPFREVLAQSVVKLSVGPGMAYAYNEASSLYPDSIILGWFHTHPGHTPFLSSIDLNQTHNLFSHPYQLAIVLDCLTPDFDTGIFSQKINGSMNNAKDYTNWLAWKKLL